MAEANQDRVARLLGRLADAESPDATFHPYSLLNAARKIVGQYRSARESEQAYAEMEWPPAMSERGRLELATAQARSFALSQAVEALIGAFEPGPQTELEQQ